MGVYVRHCIVVTAVLDMMKLLFVMNVREKFQKKTPIFILKAMFYAKNAQIENGWKKQEEFYKYLI